MDKRIVIIGGGTFMHVRNHLALCAPSFGGTARRLHKMIPGSELVLTKMADPRGSTIATNADLENYVEELIKDQNVHVIMMTAAVCDFEGRIGEDVASGPLADRLETAHGTRIIYLNPVEKIIGTIRRRRPDIFLIGFKTTTNKKEERQYLTGLRMLKKSKCNLVLGNDMVTGKNIIVTPEESYYGPFENRTFALQELVGMMESRSKGTYHTTNHIESHNTSMRDCKETFREVVQWVINHGGFIESNGQGFTPGHFCQKVDDRHFLSSQRKVDHNKVFEQGLSVVTVNDDESFTVHGTHKASVGARTQWLLFQHNPDFDCIIHTHNPLKKESVMSKRPQKAFQCGSLECGMNTLDGLTSYGENIRAVYLEKHGANVLFKSSTPAKDVIKFLDDNIRFGIKTT